jgi:hypothetical protein
MEFALVEDSSSMNTDNIAENILISILAVNGWTAERVFPLRERFRAGGLLDFAAMSKLPIENIAERLARAGYARGEYMNLFLATRVLSLATALTPSELKRLKQCLAEGRTTEVSSTLRGIKGVGPVVLETFWMLQNAD